jgi:hypothetical protein
VMMFVGLSIESVSSVLRKEVFRSCYSAYSNCDVYELAVNLAACLCRSFPEWRTRCRLKPKQP